MSDQVLLSMPLLLLFAARGKCARERPKCIQPSCDAASAVDTPKVRAQPTESPLPPAIYQSSLSITVRTLWDYSAATMVLCLLGFASPPDHNRPITSSNSSREYRWNFGANEAMSTLVEEICAQPKPNRSAHNKTAHAIDHKRWRTVCLTVRAQSAALPSCAPDQSLV